MTTNQKFDNGLKLLQEQVGCTDCGHADQSLIGYADACKDCLTDIGPCSLRCRNWWPIAKPAANQIKKAA